ncbi:putative serine esterase-domain-containing protein [Pseudomassariella vexata]|uniref:Putative serine esterase-domain-containing protein n=1 Tax=Pseudomassariella vexata TaxID=1141098 RepID=A0A1Y2DUT5_9PEZI|nr:putative serine esterase-domain-containing protein [Pseudomassariella vexata]ORY63021.1 putative serine esterase-domain-containing protein [Pseudomassariella vexata]
MDLTGGSLDADHLCILVHGLWGNPNHMRQVARALRAAHSDDRLYLLVAKRNSGSFTYDGIEKGGERVCLEIQEELLAIKNRGGKVTKLSIVGYSLGGLVARYAVGLLYSKGVFNEVEPMNFTTFASPHLGVRTPLRGWHNHLWNVLGARTLSLSGKQLFTADKFRDTQKPLLEVLATPGTIFMSGLALFKRRTLYCNVVNDRTAPYFTTGITKTDPWVDISRIKANYVEGYEDIILNPLNPISPRAPKQRPVTLSSVTTDTFKLIKKIPFLLFLGVFIPIGIVVFLLNAGFQTVRSSRRIRLHELGLLGVEPHEQLVNIMVKDVRNRIEETFEEMNNSQQPEYLGSSEDEGEDAMNEIERETLNLERKQSHPQFPTLALTPGQFDMIRNLDNLGWRKYPVWIHNHLHTHAAIIRRIDKPSFAEGHVVMQHWLNEEFVI